jgi:antitoxin component YwqK of YwqJK toxin-antitoxin module
VTEWHKNGQKSFEGNWVDGKVDGVVTFWDKEGEVTKTDTYKDGKLLEVIKL